MRSPEAQEPPFTVFFFFPSVWIYCILNLHNPVRNPIYFNSVYGSSRHRSPCKPSLTFKVYFKANGVSGRQTLFFAHSASASLKEKGKRAAIGFVSVSQSVVTDSAAEGSRWNLVESSSGATADDSRGESLSAVESTTVSWRVGSVGTG